MMLCFMTLNADCFSLDSFMIGDLQARQLLLTLVPQLPLDQLCNSLNESIGTAELIFAEQETLGLPKFISQHFTYSSGVENTVSISIEMLSSIQLSQLIKITAAEYIVKIEKAEQIRGSLDVIKYLKSDVSSCWKDILFTFNAVQNDEYIHYTMQPNDCTVPEDAILQPIFTMTENRTTLILDEFQEGTNENDYKHPYDHHKVKKAKTQCRSLSNPDQCLEIINFLITNLNYKFELQLTYQINAIETRVIQQVSRYQAAGSILCGIASNLRSFVHPDGYFLYYNHFTYYSQCLLSSNAQNVEFQISAVGKNIFNQKSYKNDLFLKNNFEEFVQPMGEFFSSKFYFRVQYVQKDEMGGVVGQISTNSEVTKQCIYRAILHVFPSRKIAFEIRSDLEFGCVRKQQKFNFSLRNLSNDEVIFQTFSGEILDQAIFMMEFKVKKKWKFEKNMTFQLKGESFFVFSRYIVMHNDVAFLVLQICYVVVYFVFGGIMCFFMVRKELFTEQF